MTNETLINRIMEFLNGKKSSDGEDGDDEYKEEWTRDKSREEFLDRIKVREVAEKKNEREIVGKDRTIVKDILKSGRERSIGDEDYREFDMYPEITESEIWKCPADFSERQKKLVKHVIEMEAIKLGIPMPKISFVNFPDEACDYGYYQHSERKMVLNSRSYGVGCHRNLFELLFTAIHELRHSYQNYMMDEPEKFPFINSLIHKYFCYEDEVYPSEERMETKEGMKEYLQNALEVDANAYANDRKEFYLGKLVSEIEQLDTVMEEPIKNQILLTISGETLSGNNSLVAIGNDYEMFVRKEKRSKFQERNNERNLSEKGECKMSGGTDLSERAQQEAVKYYMNVVQAIHQNCESMIRNFEVRIKEHPYRELQHVANTFIELHNEEVPVKIREAIMEWISSDESFSRLLQQLDEDGSSESVSAAKKLENSLADQVKNYFLSIPEIKIDKPIVVNREKIDADQRFVDGWLKELSNMKMRFVEQFEKLSSYNSIYANMISMVASTFVKVESVYDAAVTDISKVGEQFHEKKTANIGNAVTKGGQVAKTVVNIRDVFSGRRARKK